MAEALALREAVCTYNLNAMEAVSFESDSAQLIKAIKGELFGIVSDILSLSSLFKSVFFSWIPREWNILTDTLATNALSVGETLVVDGSFYGSQLTFPLVN